MKDTLTEIDRLLSTMLIDGDNVMKMAVVRSLLKQLYEEVEKHGKQEN